MTAAEVPRLRSLDALRGADMFWIVGGSTFIGAIAEATGWPALRWVEQQCEHVEWHGFRFWDLVFPLFLFLAGVSTAFSFAARRARGHDRRLLARRVATRGLTLVALGVVYNGLFAFDFSTLRFASVLGRIGLAWMFAAWIVLAFDQRGQLAWVVGILLGYWALMTLVPVPGQGSASLEPGQTLADWLDRALLPGRLHGEVRDPEGLLSTIPAIATALIGVLAGNWLRLESRTGGAKALGLVGAGAGCLLVGGLWAELAFPLNKNLWTSSFVLWTAGWSLLLLAAFYWVIDVRGLQRWSFPFVVVGMNAITIYMLSAFVDFDGVVTAVFGFAVPRRLHPAFLPALGLTLQWLVLYGLYRRRIFLRV